MKTRKQQARMAGFLYLLMGITGAFGLMYVPSQIMVEGDTSATIHNLTNSQFLFRAGIVSQLTCQAIFVFLVLSLYRLFQEVHRGYARLMVALVIAAVPIAFLNELNHLAAIHFLSSANYLGTFTADQLQSLSMLSLNLYDLGITVVSIFWGLWLLPFGLLVYKSGFIPKKFGILLVIGFCGYLVEGVTHLLFPDAPAFINTITMTAGTIGEIPVLLWLLIMGAKNNAKNNLM